MSHAGAMTEVKSLIRFYERRRWNWLLAAEFVLMQHNTACDVCGTPMKPKAYGCWHCPKCERRAEEEG